MGDLDFSNGRFRATQYKDYNKDYNKDYFFWFLLKQKHGAWLKNERTGV